MLFINGVLPDFAINTYLFITISERLFMVPINSASFFLFVYVIYE